MMKAATTIYVAATPPSRTTLVRLLFFFTWSFGWWSSTCQSFVVFTCTTPITTKTKTKTTTTTTTTSPTEQQQRQRQQDDGTHCHRLTGNRNRWGPLVPSLSSSSMSSTSRMASATTASKGSAVVNGAENVRENDEVATAKSDKHDGLEDDGDDKASSFARNDDDDDEDDDDHDDHDDEFVKTRDVLSLESIRSTLIRQEETIIFALIERSQFRTNKIIYEAGAFGDLGIPAGAHLPASSGDGDGDSGERQKHALSFLEYMLIGTEVLHSSVRRYTSPEEHAFFPDWIPSRPMSAMSVLDYPDDLLPKQSVEDKNLVNFNPALLQKYKSWIVPSLTTQGDDEQHGSAVLCDIQALQAMSRRVHYGKFVAESKYRSDPEAYHALVEAGDAGGVMELLTNRAVEEQVCRRARLKAATYGREPLLVAALQQRLEEDVATAAANAAASDDDDDDDDYDRDDATTLIASAAASAVVAAVDAMRGETPAFLLPSSSSSSSSSRPPRRKKKKKKNHRKGGGKVDPSVIESIYKDFIIPLTKDIEVAYLFRRCGRDPPPEYAPDRMSADVAIRREQEKKKNDKDDDDDDNNSHNNEKTIDHPSHL